MTLGDDLLAAVERDREDIIAFLQRFVQAPSPNPPGDTRAAAGVAGLPQRRPEGRRMPERADRRAMGPRWGATHGCGTRNPRDIRGLRKGSSHPLRQASLPASRG
jgi:hypothetical protein